MTEGEFLAGITGSDSDLVQAVAALRASGQAFCLIGGLAVNNYAEPVVTLDADFAVVSSPGVAAALKAKGFQVEEFPHSINARLPGSRLRSNGHRNSEDNPFDCAGRKRTVTGVNRDSEPPLEDVLQGKLWAICDDTCRASKRAKDRADIIRLCEDHPTLLRLVPQNLIPEIDAMRPQS